MPTMSRIEDKFPEVINGRWSPKNCTARHRVAIIIPYRFRDIFLINKQWTFVFFCSLHNTNLKLRFFCRDREEHLRIFLNHIHAFLQKQLVDYGIYIVEQVHYHCYYKNIKTSCTFALYPATQNNLNANENCSDLYFYIHLEKEAFPEALNANSRLTSVADLRRTISNVITIQNI